MTPRQAAGWMVDMDTIFNADVAGLFATLAGRDLVLYLSPARFEQENAFAGEPALIEERKGNARRLPGARRRSEHQPPARGQDAADFRNDIVDRQLVHAGRSFNSVGAVISIPRGVGTGEER